MKKPFTSVVFVAKPQSSASVELIVKINSYLKSLGIATHLDSDSVSFVPKPESLNIPLTSLEKEKVKKTKIECCIVVGGDGTMMGAARSWGLLGIDLIGVNLGRVGFLTDIAAVNCIEDINKVITGKYQKEARSVLTIDVHHSDTKVQQIEAINDFVCKSSDTKLIEFSVLVDNEFVYSQYCDGLIVSTPTGSTAYSVAAGGSIIHPISRVWSIVPICPQNLSNRPLIVSDESEIKIIYSSAGPGALDCLFDGIKTKPIESGSFFILKKHKQKINLVHGEGYNYYNGLRQKLNWNKN